MLEDLDKINKHKKIILYKDALIKYINVHKNEEIKWKKSIENLNNKLTNLDYIVGILFLTEMNRNCKSNNISIHGYYITCSLINLFSNIKRKLLLGKKIPSESILYLFYNIGNNVDYLNTRVDITNSIRKKINENLSNLFVEIMPLLNSIVYYKKTHKEPTNLELIDNQLLFGVNNNCENKDIEYLGLCNKNCYNCWVTEIMTKFFYILLIIAKFMGTGQTKDPNLYKLAEYYSNIFYTILKLDNMNNNKNIEINNKMYDSLFINYQDYKSKLIYSIIELNINSDTIDEIINYLDAKIINRFLERKLV